MEKNYEVCQKIGLDNHILTAGYLLSDKKFAKEVLKYGTIQIHFDTIDENKFMEVRHCNKDYYQKVLKGIKNIIELNEKDKLSLCIKILKQNVNTIKETIDWALDDLHLPPSAILIGPYTPPRSFSVSY